MSGLSLSMHLCNATVSLQYLPVQMEINRRAKRYEKAQAKASGETKESVVDKIKEVFSKDTEDTNIKKEVKKVAKEFGCEDLTSEEEKEIVESIDSVADSAKAVMRASKTHNLTKYAIYYMSQENAKLEKLSKDEKEFVNGVAAYFGVDSIYKDEAIMDLTKIDPTNKNYDKSSKLHVSMSSLDRLKNNEKLIDAIKAKYNKDDVNDFFEVKKPDVVSEEAKPEEETTENNNEAKVKFTVVKDEDTIHPISFGVVGESTSSIVDKPKFSENMSTEIQDKLESALGPYLQDMDYRYEMHEENLIWLLIKRNDHVEESYIVDVGSIIGLGKVYIMANIENNDTIFVEVKDRNRDIIKEILKSRFFILSSNEVQRVSEDFFKNQKIYSFIDMTNTEYLNDISKEDFFKLGKKLTFIVNQIKNMGSNVNNIPRFRFESFESVDKFSIVSDAKCNSPLRFMNATYSLIVEGLRFEVEGDRVVQRYMDQGREFIINEYKDL